MLRLKLLAAMLPPKAEGLPEDGTNIDDKTESRIKRESL